jgi:hypothetical protein
VQKQKQETYEKKVKDYPTCSPTIQTYLENPIQQVTLIYLHFFSLITSHEYFYNLLLLHFRKSVVEIIKNAELCYFVNVVSYSSISREINTCHNIAILKALYGISIEKYLA